MTMRFRSIVIHKPDRGSETDSSSPNSSDETEIAEVAETAILKYIKQNSNRRSERQRNMANKSRKANLSRSSSTSSFESNELPILRMLTPEQSFPLFLSHYIPDTDSRLQDKLSRKSSEEKSTMERGDRLGLNLLNSGSRPLHPAFQQRRVSSINDLKSTVTLPHVQNKDFEDEGSSNGLSKLFKTLNFSERLRQHKAEQERLNINNLPAHMREQLKHIYVY